ncbi:MAG: hypothetical protein RIT04_444 [Candidatus Parcubacteria bacterium]|jgi:hypothetical protein
MKKYINNIQYVLILAAILVLAPASAKAATVYLEATRSAVSVGDTTIIAVKINAEGKEINTVDGEIVLKSTTGSGAVEEFSLANSAFGLWPRTPSLSQDGRTISFVGGVPGGFSIEGATLFNIVVDATKEGALTIAPQNISVYANDGKGNKLPVQLKGITINVGAKKAGIPVQNDWAGAVSRDTAAPEDFIIVPGQDNTLFEGKKFVYFSSVDNQTGIDHYDVSENGRAVVRSGSTYVLQDQKGPVSLNVVAYDKAGNKKVATYTEGSQPIAWVPVIIIVLVGVVVWFVLKKLFKRNKVNASPKL